jgi:hypothetical protein
MPLERQLLVLHCVHVPKVSEAAYVSNVCFTATNSYGSALPTVEMELGLLDEASEKFTRALGMNDYQIRTPASYGLGRSLLLIAKRHLQDGKVGAAKRAIDRGIECCISVDDKSTCISKLIGDLHSFGAMLSPDVFSAQASDESQDILAQSLFVAEGASYYKKAADCLDSTVDDNSRLSKACLLADIGANLLSQSRLFSQLEGKGLGIVSSKATAILRSAETEFIAAIELHPEYSAAWCGLGCALRQRDPLLSQHAFCRATELDTLSSESYANLSFLYTVNDATDASELVSDAITKIADTPYMWINRALLSELRALDDRSIEADALIEQAADAYRAAMQVSTTTVAKEGLALNCRVGARSHKVDSEACYLLKECLESEGTINIPAMIFEGLMAMETGIEELIQSARNQALMGMQRMKELSVDDNLTAQSMDMDVISSALATVGARADEMKSEASDIHLARLIFYQPDRGDLWLEMAKSLVLQHETLSEPQLNEAREALQKGRQIIAAASVTVACRTQDMSDALALEYWLRIQSSKQQERSRSSRTDLQKSLLLNPGNGFAREILTLE